MNNQLKHINDMLEIAKIATDRIKEENRSLRAENDRLTAENERLIAIIESLTKER